MIRARLRGCTNLGPGNPNLARAFETGKMKRRTLQVLRIGLLIQLLGLIGCGDVSQKDCDDLKAENQELARQLDELRFGADRLLGKARAHIDGKDFDNAKYELETLLDKHPGSEQSTEAKKLLVVVDDEIEKQMLVDQKADELAAKQMAEEQKVADELKAKEAQEASKFTESWAWMRGQIEITNQRRTKDDEFNEYIHLTIRNNSSETVVSTKLVFDQGYSIGDFRFYPRGDECSNPYIAKGRIASKASRVFTIPKKDIPRYFQCELYHARISEVVLADGSSRVIM